MESDLASFTYVGKSLTGTAPENQVTFSCNFFSRSQLKQFIVETMVDSFLCFNFQPKEKIPRKTGKKRQVRPP